MTRTAPTLRELTSLPGPRPGSRMGRPTAILFLLPGTLQVDLAFVQATEFRPLAHTFRLVFGTANEPRNSPLPKPGGIIGLGWLYALHARSCIARKRLWQAEYMVSGIRDNALALACIRYGLPAVHGRGIDGLPTEVAAQFEGALVRQVSTAELCRAFQVAVERFRVEVQVADEKLGERLQETLASLSEELRSQPIASGCRLPVE
jgi:hypothetical protein